MYTAWLRRRKKILSKRAGEIEKERKNIARNIYNIIIYVHNGE